MTKALNTQSLSVPAERTLGRVIVELNVKLDRMRGRRDALESEIEEVFLAHPLGPVLMGLPGYRPKDRSTDPRGDR